jgi:hypothetical protein
VTDVGVTATEIVQVAPAASVPPEKPIVDEPAVAVIVPAPQVVLVFGVGATTRPAGNACDPVMRKNVSAPAPAPVFAIVIVYVETCEYTIAFGTNDGVTLTGGETTTVDPGGAMNVTPWVVEIDPLGKEKT